MPEFMVSKEHILIESCENTWKTIPVNKIVSLDQYLPQKGFFKPENSNAHNFLISGRIWKIQSSPESLFRAYKKKIALI